MNTKTKIELINASIGHSLTQGEETEKEIISLLIDYLPDNYGIGSGVIIDIEGNSSKQVDIIIYDKNRADYTLSKSSKIFLADHVIAGIEVKTTYSTGKNSSLEKGLENIASIKKLKVAQRQWIEPRVDQIDESFAVTKYNPNPPLGILFFFQGKDTQSAINIDNFFRQLEKSIGKIDLELQPDLLFSLENAATFRYKDPFERIKQNQSYHVCLVQGNGSERAVSIPNLTKDTKAVVDFSETIFVEGDVIQSRELKSLKNNSQIVLFKGDKFHLNPIIYRTAEIKNKLYLLDKFRAFLHFIYVVELYLATKKTSKSWTIQDYFGEDFATATDYFNDFVDE